MCQLFRRDLMFLWQLHLKIPGQGVQHSSHFEIGDVILVHSHGGFITDM